MDFLTAMFTPAVLISACGTLIFSTSTRLGRIVDRVRVLLIGETRMAIKSIDSEMEFALRISQRLQREREE